MTFLWHSDSTFNPPVVESWFGLKKINKEDLQVDINGDDVVGDSKTKTANTSSASSTPSCTSLKKCTAFLDELMEYFEQMEEQKPRCH